MARDRAIPGWTAGDVRYAAEALGWPAVPFRGAVVRGEDDWTAALALATPDELAALHEALPGDDDDDEDDDEDDDDEDPDAAAE
jgi:hypothetical protein